MKTMPVEVTCVWEVCVSNSLETSQAGREHGFPCPVGEMNAGLIHPDVFFNCFAVWWCVCVCVYSICVWRQAAQLMTFKLL